MRRCRSWYRNHQLLHTHLPLPPGSLAARGGNVHTLRRRLCDGLKDDADRQDAWGADQELDVETCFAPLLTWVLSWRMLPGPEAPPPLVLAVDPTQGGPAGGPDGQCGPQPDGPAGGLADGAAQASRSWMDILCRLLEFLAPAVADGDGSPCAVRPGAVQPPALAPDPSFGLASLPAL